MKVQNQKNFKKKHSNICHKYTSFTQSKIVHYLFNDCSNHMFAGQELKNHNLQDNQIWHEPVDPQAR